MSCSRDIAVPSDRTRAEVGVYAVAAIVFAACAGVTIYFCRSMAGGMSMPGGWTMSMTWMRMPGQSWPGAFLMFMEMWAAMMVAMMLPSALPMILRFSREGRSAWVSAAGYFFVWIATGIAIYVPGIVLAQAAMRWESVGVAVPFIVGAAVVLAGTAQFTPWKTRSLSRCRGPLSCATTQPVGPRRSAWSEGFRCGVCCITCCFGPTLILLSLGMMNPLVIVLVTAIIALEKLLPEPRFFIRTVGVCAIAGGFALICHSALVR